ncbi:unnamed protein product [Pleuronectes platessa]|uniref:Uncharacterized protein n=1 Tax=Pleuronectes platessa TaxID=8262 RepID=A0A9N7YZL7_PLEPL|nr:unnamed protein product [Pleuronectes platessa]
MWSWPAGGAQICAEVTTFKTLCSFLPAFSGNQRFCWKLRGSKQTMNHIQKNKEPRDLRIIGQSCNGTEIHIAERKISTFSKSD